MTFSSQDYNLFQDSGRSRKNLKQFHYFEIGFIYATSRLPRSGWDQ